MMCLSMLFLRFVNKALQSEMYKILSQNYYQEFLYISFQCFKPFYPSFLDFLNG